MRYFRNRKTSFARYFGIYIIFNIFKLWVFDRLFELWRDVSKIVIEDISNMTIVWNKPIIIFQAQNIFPNSCYTGCSKFPEYFPYGSSFLSSIFVLYTLALANLIIENILFLNKIYSSWFLLILHLFLSFIASKISSFSQSGCWGFLTQWVNVYFQSLGKNSTPEPFHLYHYMCLSFSHGNWFKSCLKALSSNVLKDLYLIAVARKEALNVSKLHNLVTIQDTDIYDTSF